MTRVAVARAISIAGHPIVILFVAASVAASTRPGSLPGVWFIGGALALAIVILGFSWIQVRSGRWSHIDASARSERKTLNVFLGAICFGGAMLAWSLTGNSDLSVGLILSGTIAVIALLIAKWVKVSLHVAFAAFATALGWPNEIAIVAGLLVTAVLAWSRLVLGRHVAADIVAGFLLGATAGSVYHFCVP